MEHKLYSNDSELNQKYLLAKKRTENLRKFYKHLVIYVLVNSFISGFKIKDYVEGGFTFEEAFSQFDVYIVWLVWGAFVALQALRTFNSNLIGGADWEERKIREYMNEK